LSIAQHLVRPGYDWAAKYKVSQTQANNDEPEEDGVRLCSGINPPKSDSLPELYKLDGSKVTDWSWTCPTKMSYWNKFHEFYLPNGSFSRKELNMSDGTIKFRNILYLSELYQKKYKALGIKVSDSGNGRKSCMARINLSTHRENKIVNILNNF
jgi:hypothetical protein